MSDQRPTGNTRVSLIIDAAAEELYQAFMDPAQLVQWLPPGEMTGKIHSFDPRVGGGYRMSLFYPESEKESRGKSSEREDVVNSRFLELDPPRRIVQGVIFESADTLLAGEMRMVVTFEPQAVKPDSDEPVRRVTDVTILCTDIPPGVRPEDNETGSRMSLEQLARFVKSRGEGDDHESR